jgi:hypothetical protein
MLGASNLVPFGISAATAIYSLIWTDIKIFIRLGIIDF